MTSLRLGAASLNQTPLDWSGNKARINEALRASRAKGAGFVCFPELCTSGYGAEDAFLWPETAQRSLRMVEELATENPTSAFALGLPLWVDGSLYNAVAVVAGGSVLGFAAKRHLAGDGLHYEPRWFSPWPRGAVRQAYAQGRFVSVGDVVFQLGKLRIGFEICEDAWVSERPGKELRSSHVDLICNPSASHFSFGKHEVRRKLVETGSREFAATYLYVNLLGNEAGRAIYDGDSMIADQGRVVASGERFSFAPVEVLYWDRPLPSEHPPGPLPGERSVIPCAWEFPGIEEVALPHVARPLTKEQCFGLAVSLGLFDYARKSQSRGFVLSLSGGADSSACAILVALMTARAVAQFGVEEAARILVGHELGSEVDLKQEVLWTAYQATQNSGPVTRAAAAAVAEAVGARHDEWDVEPLVQAYEKIAENALGRELSWATDDVARQNIQARVRAPSVWFLANVRGALLLSTSNRSEAAVGYATMDGDTSGGLAPLAGIDKAYLRRWLVWVEQEGFVELGPVPALRLVNQQAPTAELRPSSSAQTDEGDLMPYEVLNAIESAFLVGRWGPASVLEAIRRQFPEASEEDRRRWVERFFRLFARNQWKRERYAPSFHLDDRGLDPKTWCRFPILSGGFADELRELKPR